jgi:hypothetical protein
LQTSNVLAFEPIKHEYRYDGQRVPSVTQILRETGISVDFDELAGMSHRLGLAIDEKRAIGTALHADCHAFDDNDLEWSTVDPRVVPYLEAWKTLRENSGLVPLRRERRVYHPGYRYAGTLDGIFAKDASTSVLVDIKTGDPESSGARYQLAAYQLAHETESDHTTIHERWSVQLTPGRRVPYRIARYDDWRDFDTWKAIVSTYWAQAARRKEFDRGTV